MSGSHHLLLESNAQVIGAWKQFARRATSGVVFERDGLAVTFANSPMPIVNAQFLSSPAPDAADFERRVAAACAYAKGVGLPWIFSVCNEWAPPEAVSIVTAAGLAVMMPWTGMVAEALAPPARPMPLLDIRPTYNDAQAQHDVMALNAAAYGMPVEPMLTMNSPGMWTAEMYGRVGYVDGVAVSTATTFAVDGVLYVALVATHPGHQKKGYAEALMRASLEAAASATGLTRTVLHATEAGRPVYTRMGYQPTSTFTCFIGM